MYIAEGTRPGEGLNEGEQVVTKGSLLLMQLYEDAATVEAGSHRSDPIGRAPETPRMLVQSTSLEHTPESHAKATFITGELLRFGRVPNRPVVPG